MARRKAYTELRKVGQVRPAHVKGSSQAVYKGFQCLAADCTHFIFKRASELVDGVTFACPACGFEFDLSRGETRLFDYEMLSLADGLVVERGAFSVDHAAYIKEAEEFKYCLLCYTLKPLDRFDKHSRMASGRQGECNACKTTYNSIKNQTRLSDQHREAAQRRRLYSTLAAGTKIDSDAVITRFDGRCFNCGCPLSKEEARMDHTLPVKLLWPITTDTATLLCARCNGEKDRKWPSEFYEKGKLKALSRLTSIPYEVLAGPPILNDEAVNTILADPDGFIEMWVKYPDEVKAMRRFIRETKSVDIFEGASTIPAYLQD